MKVLRLASGVVLIAALFYFGLIDLNGLRLALAHPGMLAISAAMLIAAQLAAGLRWQILLRSQGLALSLVETLRIVFVSGFFAIFLPGGAGGDLVRGVYMFRAAPGRRITALLSLLIDRLVGLGGILSLGVAAVLLRPGGRLGLIDLGILAMAAILLVGVALLLRFGHRIARLLGALLGGRSKRLVLFIDEMSEALEQYSSVWPTVLACMLISMGIGILSIGAIVVIAEAMLSGVLGLVDYGIAGIYAQIANIIPVTPGGLGVGEGAFASACVALEHVPTGRPYGTIFLVFRCIVAISALPGLVLYLLYPHGVKLLQAVAMAEEVLLEEAPIPTPQFDDP